MNKILELREKRAKAWEAAKAFLDTKRGADGLVSPEDTATYEKMEADVVALGKEIDRLEKQEALDRELSKPLNTPLTGKPAVPGMDTKTGKASDEYRKAFWNAMRTRAGEGLDSIVKNALQVGTDTEGGYLVPDEFEHAWRLLGKACSVSLPTLSPLLRIPNSVSLRCGILDDEEALSATVTTLQSGDHQRQLSNDDQVSELLNDGVSLESHFNYDASA